MNKEKRHCPECPQSYMEGFRKGQEMGMKVAQDVIRISTQPISIVIPTSGGDQVIEDDTPPGQHPIDTILIDKPDGWVITKPGRESQAFSHHHNALGEAKRLGYKTIRPFIYLEGEKKID